MKKIFFIFLFLTGCQPQYHVYHPGQGPGIDVLDHPLSADPVYLPEPLPCDFTVHDAKELKEQLGFTTKENVHVWNLREDCDFEHTGGRTIVRVLGGLYVGYNISYYSWPPSLAVPGEPFRIFHHETRHQMNQRHCSDPKQYHPRCL